MTFRVTPSVLFAHARYNMATTYARFAKAQNQISTGKRISVFSQDPSAASRALDLKTTLSKTIQQRESVESARFAADSQAAILEEISGLIIEARATGLDAANGIKSPSDLKAIAAELGATIDLLVAKANQRFEGRFLFAGSNIDTIPFQSTTSFGSISSVTYAGDNITRKVRLGPADVKNVDLSGEEAFLNFQRGDTNIASQIGLKSVTGANDTMIGSAKIIVTHSSTVIGDAAGPGGGDSASGIAPGLSTANDTLIGDTGQHSLTMNVDVGGAGTISLNGGDPVQFDGTETDLDVTGGDGEVIHLDMTTVVPGFNGTIDLVGNADIQVEGGPAQAMAFTTDLALQDGNGRAVHVDTSAVNREGDSLAVFSGTETVFDALISLRDEILGNAGFPHQGMVDRIQARLQSLDRAHEGILAGAAELGARSSSFDRIASSLSLFELSLDEKRGELEDTDLFTASLELSQSENAYQAALMATAKLNGPSLMNFL